jgi:hypothetical protein
MNERIQELANQAYGITDAKPFHPSALIHLEKFAELIVRECANRIDYWESRQGEHCDDLLKHFGVKE